MVMLGQKGFKRIGAFKRDCERLNEAMMSKYILKEIKETAIKSRKISQSKNILSENESSVESEVFIKSCELKQSQESFINVLRLSKETKKCQAGLGEANIP